MLFHFVDKVPDFHMCPKLKLDRSIVGIEREWGGVWSRPENWPDRA